MLYYNNNIIFCFKLCCHLEWVFILSILFTVSSEPMALSVWLYSQCFSLLPLLQLEHYLISILTSSYPAAGGTLFAININLILSCSCWNIFYHQFLARLTLPLLGYYLPFIIDLCSRIISKFWCFLIMNMEDREGAQVV